MYFKFSIFLLLLVNASARSANWYFPGYDIATVTTIKPSNPDTTNIRFNPEAKRISQQSIIFSLTLDSQIAKKSFNYGFFQNVKITRN